MDNNITIQKGLKLSLLFAFLYFLNSCATLHEQIGKSAKQPITDDFGARNISHTFYLVGDAGNPDPSAPNAVLENLAIRLKSSKRASTLLFLGDNIYPDGIPAEASAKRETAIKTMERQMSVSDNFKGRTIFIPGNHDWRSGINGLEAESNIVIDRYKDSTSFMPRKNCGIDNTAINDSIQLITVDSEWFLEDWDKHPRINENCTIKTRDQFYNELQNLISDNQNKNVVIALHHPLASNGRSGGEYSWRQQLFPFQNNFPLPFLGSAFNAVRKTSGIVSQDIQNKKYNAMVNRITTIVQGKPNIVLVSGHDHNLQYIERGNVKQIISGSGFKTDPARAIGPKDFSYGGQGYARFEINKTGASKLTFYGIEKDGSEKIVFEQQVVETRAIPKIRVFPTKFDATKDTSIYSAKMAKRTGVYRFFWGNHYRKYYGVPIHADAVRLDTLYGGLTPSIARGADNSKALRLIDGKDREYELKALKKDASKFLQRSAFKNFPIEEDFRDTYTSNFVLDFYTTALPYAPLVVKELAKDANIAHANPKLFYVPKQNALGFYNGKFGDELYNLQEWPSDKWLELPSFGKPSRILNTEEMLAKLQQSKNNSVDQASYLRARMFDIFIGDWDRGPEQWSWGEFRDGDKLIFKPISRNHDQAFFKYDGLLVSVLINFPQLRQMRKFDENLKNVKWLNREAYDLDLKLLPKATEKDWMDAASFLEKNISTDDIQKAFLQLPKEIVDDSTRKIALQLDERKTHLQKYASQYFKVLKKTVLVVGTESRDRFEIERSGDSTTVQQFVNIDNNWISVYKRSFHKPETKEIWIYGLGGDDQMNVSGRGRKKIKIRLFGGHNDDQYDVSNGGKIKIYDFKKGNHIVQSNGARVRLSNDYETNTYDYEKPIYDVAAGYPLAGYNPDDGIKFGGVVNYKVNGFHRFPYTQKHSVQGNYYFSTGGFELSYKGVFPHILGDWNLLLNGLYTSPNFSINYFGSGNETENLQDIFGKNYNRVKIRKVLASPSFQLVGDNGGSLLLTGAYERVSIAKSLGRFISLPNAVDESTFEFKSFADASAGYTFANYDNFTSPTLGFRFKILGGYKLNLDESEKSFSYSEAEIALTSRLVRSGRIVFATKFAGRTLFENTYDFYHASMVGGDLSLRGFRNERFYGKQMYFQSSDLRWNFGKLKNGIAPFSYGTFVGYDYGRVWQPGENSDKWHQSAGGGLYLNGANLFTAKISYFQSGDGGRVSAGIGFGF